MQLNKHDVGYTSFFDKKRTSFPQINIRMGMMECKRQGVHKLFSSNGTKQAYSKFNFPSNMPIRLAITLRKDCAERSEAIVLRKTGGRQNEVLLRTLKRTRLAQRVHVSTKKMTRGVNY